MRSMILLGLALLFCGPTLFAAQQPIEEHVVVTANAYPVPFENLSRAVTVFTGEDIKKMPVNSITDLLAQAASVDIRSRGAFGMQADLSVRGSAFSQVLVLVDGMRINDSQTAHHNGDFPVQLHDIERVEVLLGPGSSIYGADAFGGIVNFITRQPSERLGASVKGGQDGFWEGSFSAGIKKGRVRQSIGLTANRSSGFEYARDFRSHSISGRSHIGDRTVIGISHLNKEFGAKGFYGPAPSREWTNQTLVSLARSFEKNQGLGGTFQAFYRTHGDRFIYDIRSPGLFQSTHRTHAATASARLRWKLGNAALLTFGGEAGGDWIASNTLGHHSIARTSVFGELQWQVGKAAAVYPGLRFDQYSDFGSSVSPSLSGSWWVIPRLRLRSSIGRAFRIPTFTELYYRDPNHTANPGLKPESAWSEELGADFMPAGNWLGSITFFSRQEKNVIDWVRGSTTEKWRTANIRRLRTTGVELGVEHPIGSAARIAARYSRIAVETQNLDLMSKYVLDYARDSWSGSASVSLPLSFSYLQTAGYKKRADGRSYWLLDGRLERRFMRFTVALDLTNMLNTRYQEVRGVNMPGRWFALSIGTK